MIFRVWGYNQWRHKPHMIFEFAKLQVFIWRFPTWEFNAEVAFAGLGVGFAVRRRIPVQPSDGGEDDR